MKRFECFHGGFLQASTGTSVTRIEIAETKVTHGPAFASTLNTLLHSPAKHSALGFSKHDQSSKLRQRHDWLSRGGRALAIRIRLNPAHGAFGCHRARLPLVATPQAFTHRVCCSCPDHLYVEPRADMVTIIVRRACAARLRFTPGAEQRTDWRGLAHFSLQSQTSCISPNLSTSLPRTNP